MSDPRHRPRGAHASCCATAGAPPASGGCGPCSTTASRSTARSSCAPACNDGAVLDDTLRRRARPASPSWRQPLCGAPGCESSYNTEAAHAAAHPGRGGRAVDRRRCTTGRTSTCATLGHRLVFAADEYYLLAGEPFPEAARPTRASRCTRTASAWRAPSSWSSPGPWPSRRPASPGRLLRVGRRRARPRATAPPAPNRRCRPRPPPRAPVATPRAPVPLRQATTARTALGATAVAHPAPPHRAGGHPHGHLRRLGAPAPPGRARARRRACACPVENRVLRGQHRRRRAASTVTRSQPACSHDEPPGHRYLLPDVCLSQGRFLDGTTPEELPRPVEVVADRWHRPPGRPGGPMNPPTTVEPTEPPDAPEPLRAARTRPIRRRRPPPCRWWRWSVVPTWASRRLFNRIVGHRREAIVEEKPGVTRDRKDGPCRVAGTRPFLPGRHRRLDAGR